MTRGSAGLNDVRNRHGFNQKFEATRRRARGRFLVGEPGRKFGVDGESALLAEHAKLDRLASKELGSRDATPLFLASRAITRFGWQGQANAESASMEQRDVLEALIWRHCRPGGQFRTQFSDEDMKRLALAYVIAERYRSVNAALRVVRKGAAVELDSSLRFEVEPSDEADSIRIRDDRLRHSSPGRSGWATAAVVEGQPRLRVSELASLEELQELREEGHPNWIESYRPVHIPGARAIDSEIHRSIDSAQRKACGLTDFEADQLYEVLLEHQIEDNEHLRLGVALIPTGELSTLSIEMGQLLNLLVSSQPVIDPARRKKPALLQVDEGLLIDLAEVGNGWGKTFTDFEMDEHDKQTIARHFEIELHQEIGRFGTQPWKSGHVLKDGGEVMTDVDASVQIGSTLVVVDCYASPWTSDLDEGVHSVTRNRAEHLERKTLKWLDGWNNRSLIPGLLPNGVKDVLPVVCTNGPEWIRVRSSHMWLKGETPRALTRSELKTHLGSLRLT